MALDDIARRDEGEPTWDISPQATLGEADQHLPHPRRLEIVGTQNCGRDGDHNRQSLDAGLQTFMLDGSLAVAIRQVPPEGIERLGFVAGLIMAMPYCTERARHHDLFDTGIKRGPQQMPRRKHVAGEDLVMITIGGRDLARAMIEMATSADRRGPEAGVAEIPDHLLHTEACYRRLVARRVQQ